MSTPKRQYRKIPPELKTPDELLRKWSSRNPGGERRRFRKVGNRHFKLIQKLNEELAAKEKRLVDRRVNAYLEATRRQRLFTPSELTSPERQEQQIDVIETSLRVKARLEAKAAERAARYTTREPLRNVGRGAGRGRGPSKPKVIEIDGVSYSFYPARAVATQLNISTPHFWRWRKTRVLPDYCIVDWRGRRWYPEPYLLYAHELGLYHLEACVSGDNALWRFKAYAVELWEMTWKAKMPPISGIKMPRHRFITVDWLKFVPDDRKQEAEKNVSATGSAFGGAKTSTGVRGFRHLRVHAPYEKPPQTPAT